MAQGIPSSVWPGFLHNQDCYTTTFKWQVEITLDLPKPGACHWNFWVRRGTSWIYKAPHLNLPGPLPGQPQLQGVETNSGRSHSHRQAAPKPSTRKKSWRWSWPMLLLLRHAEMVQGKGWPQQTPLSHIPWWSAPAEGQLSLSLQHCLLCDSHQHLGAEISPPQCAFTDQVWQSFQSSSSWTVIETTTFCKHIKQTNGSKFLSLSQN